MPKPASYCLECGHLTTGGGHSWYCSARRSMLQQPKKPSVKMGEITVRITRRSDED